MSFFSRRRSGGLNGDGKTAGRKGRRGNKAGVCSWCEKDIDFPAEGEDGPIEEYVAFGAYQERHLFCSLKCLEAFRKQYPVRIHRNCYETDCNTCDRCIRRYDTKEFKRAVID